MVGVKEKPEFPRRLYTKGEDPYPCKSITYYSNDSKLFPALLAALSEDEWEELLESRLGVFLKFFQLDFGWASRLVHYVLGFQLECKKKYEIWSLVGVNPIRFSLNEFELLTGLNCEYVEDEQPEIEVTEEMKEFWEQRLGVAVDTGPSIEQLTRACSFAESWSREDRIRLGYLAIFAGFIEARKAAAPTRLNLARLVMDLDTFENYPWGRVAFKNLVDSVKQKDLAKSYTVEGFVEVLQVWVYYAMPDFATEYGDPIAGKPTPPMLAFKGSRGRKYVKESMLRQTRFNHFVMKDREDMFPTWDDDEEDVRIENIVRAAFREFGNVPWRWNKSHWQVEGVLPSVQISSKGNSEYSVENKGSRGSDEASRKRSRPSTSSYMDESRSFVDVIKRHFDECCKSITSEMRTGFERCDYNLKFLTGKLEAVEHTLAIMKERKGEEDVMEKGNQQGHGETHGDAEQVKSNEHGADLEAEAVEEDQLRVSSKPSPKPTTKTATPTKRGRKKRKK